MMKQQRVREKHLYFALAVVAVFGPQEAVVAEPLGSAFTYQGQLKRDGTPANELLGFEFSLWDDAGSGCPPEGGSQMGSALSFPSLPLTNGLFTAELDFSTNAFNSQARWLQITVAGTVLCPRHEVTATPYALHLPHGTAPVFNVRDFGATGEGSCSDRCRGNAIEGICADRPSGVTIDTCAVLRAVAAMPDEGGILYFASGTYYINGGSVCLKSRTSVLGDGRGSKLVRCQPAGCWQNCGGCNGGVLNTVQKTDVRIANLSIDLNSVADELACLDFFRGENITVDSCHIGTGVPLTADHRGKTLKAVNTSNVSGLWVTNNRIEGLQIRAGGETGPSSGGGPGVFINNNHISNPHNFGISFVSLGTGDDHLSDATISDNVIDDVHSSGGIHIGGDGVGAALDSVRRLVIRNNVISGEWHPDTRFGIYVRMSADSEDWIIDGNLIDDKAASVGNTAGILIRPSAEQSRPLKSLSVVNNMVRHVRGAGIQIGGPVSGFVVSGNLLEGTAGIQLRVSKGELVDGIITSNYANGARHVPPDTSVDLSTGHGLFVWAKESDIGPILVRDNIYKNHHPLGYTDACDDESTDFAAGIAVFACCDRTVSADFSGNKCYDDQDEKTQEFCVEERGAGNFNTRYVNNDCRGNRTAGLKLTRSAMVRHNLGWEPSNGGTITESQGQGTIIEDSDNSDNSKFTVIAHGLSVTPSAHDITVTPTGMSANDPGLIWVSGVTPSDFTVRCANNPGNPGLGFSWHAAVVPQREAPKCGNGWPDPGESCDDGFRDACGTCSADCTGQGSGATCGDGDMCPEIERCDDGNEDNTDACVAGCVCASCGDGYVWSGRETCDDGANNGAGEGAACLIAPACNSAAMVPGRVRKHATTARTTAAARDSV